MTKEELKQEARQKALEWNGEKINGKYNRPPIANWSCYEKGYLASAEPREKRIAELEAQIEKVKHYLDYDIPLDFINEATIKIWRMLK